jgi:hypothetical protein
VGLDPHPGIQRAHRLRQRGDLRPADIRGAVRHLPVQIREFHSVIVDDADRADPRSRQVGHAAAPQPARTDHQHPRGAEPALSELAEAGQQDLPLRPCPPILAQLVDRPDEWHRPCLLLRTHAAIVGPLVERADD